MTSKLSVEKGVIALHVQKYWQLCAVTVHVELPPDANPSQFFLVPVSPFVRFEGTKFAFFWTDDF